MTRPPLRCRSRFALATLLICFVCALPAVAQGVPPPVLGDPGNPYFLDEPFSLPPLDALQTVFERQRGGSYLLTKGYLSDLNARFAVRAPRLYYRDQGFITSMGSQMLINGTPFHNNLPFLGGRLAFVTPRVSWTLFGGRIENLDELLSNGTMLDRPFMGGAYGYRPNAYSGYSASWMSYASRDRGSIDRTLGAVNAFFSDRRYYALSVSYGRDVGSARLPDEKTTAREGWAVSADYSRKRLTASVAAISWGRLFGPPMGFGDQRGQHNVVASLRYQLSNNLALTESYVLNGQETAGVATGPMSVTSNWQHGVSWTPVPGVNVNAGVQTTQNGNGVGPTTRNTGLFLQAGGQAGSVYLGGDARQDALAAGSRNQLLHLRAGLPLSPYDTVFLDNTYYSTTTTSQPRVDLLQSALGYSRTFADERGVASIQYSRQLPLAVTPTTSLTNNTTLAVAYRPIGSLWLAGTLNMSNGSQPGSASTYSEARIRYIIDEHSDFSLYKRFSSGGITVYDFGRNTQLKDTWQLQYRLSFGGPIQRSIQLDRLGRLTVLMLATPAGQKSPSPLADVPVRIGDKTVRTDRQGRAIVRDLPPGTYAVSLASNALPGTYALEGPRSRKVEVAPGEFTTTSFNTTAWASVYAVTWSDAEGTGKLPETAYTPFPRVRIRILGQGERVTGDEGTADFGRLPPGRYTVTLDTSTLPRGMVATTAMEQVVDLKPGQEGVVAFGLQGFGRLAGRVRQQAAPGGSAPLGGVALWADGKPLGATDAEGRFDLRISAGHHAISLDPAQLTSARYVVDGPVGVDVAPDATINRDLDVASYGAVTVQFVRADRPGVRADVSGAVVNFSGEPSFLYSDEHGQVVFDRQKVGVYTVSVDPASLPNGTSLVGPASVKVNLASGQRALLQFQVRPR